jgi:membrane glycosyltransferase
MVLILLDPAERRAFGGVGALSAGFAAEFVMSALLAPVRMLIACRAVFEVVCGIDTGWNAQRRSASETSLAEAWPDYRAPTVVGLALLAIAAPFSDLVIWMAPIIIGLVFSAPIAVATSSAKVGQIARRFGVFATPEEIGKPFTVEAPLGGAVEAEEAAAPTYA